MNTIVRSVSASMKSAIIVRGHFVEFRECFYLNARNNGSIRTLDELSLIMRSLGMSPTISELKKYLKEKGNQL